MLYFYLFEYYKDGRALTTRLVAKNDKLAVKQFKYIYGLYDFKILSKAVFDTKHVED